MKAHALATHFLLAGVVVSVWAPGAAAAVAKPPGAPAASVAVAADLAPKWQVGRADRFTADIDKNEEVAVEGRDDLHQDLPSTRRVGFSRKVVGVDAEGVTIELVYERAMVDIRSGGVRIELDTTQATPGGNENLMLDLMEAMGRPLTIRFTTKGEIIKVDGRDPVPGDHLGPMSQALMDNSFLGLLCDALHGPRKSPGPTNAGESWEVLREVPVQIPGKLTLTERRTLSELRDGRAVINVGGAAAFTPVEGSGISDPKVEGVQVRGHLTWNVAEGVLDEVTSDQLVTFAFSAQGMKARVKSHLIARVRRVSGAAAERSEKPAAPAASPAR